MDMTDGLKSHIRTYVPIALGQLAGLLVAFLATRFGIEISGELAYSLTAAATTAVLYSAGRWLETRRWAPARAAGRFLLSLGINVGKPTYDTTAARPTMAARPGRRHTQ